MSLVRRAAAVAAVIAGTALAAPAAQAWTPEAATYGVGSRTNIAVTMSEGTVLWVQGSLRPK